MCKLKKFRKLQILLLLLFLINQFNKILILFLFFNIMKNLVVIKIVIDRVNKVKYVVFVYRMEFYQSLFYIFFLDLYEGIKILYFNCQCLFNLFLNMCMENKNKSEFYFFIYQKDIILEFYVIKKNLFIIKIYNIFFKWDISDNSVFMLSDVREQCKEVI